MSQFKNKLENEKNDKSSINTNNDSKIKIINNSEFSNENNNDEINSINKMNYSYKNKFEDNKNVNIPSLLNNKLDTNHLEESEENSDDETDLEREAAILLNKQYEHIKKLKDELNMKNNEIIDLNNVIEKLNYQLQEGCDNNKIIRDLKNEIAILNSEKNNLKLELSSKEKLIYELKTDLNSLSKKFTDLNQNLNSFSDIETNEKINNLISQNKKYLREIKLNEEKILSYEREMNKLNKNLKNEMRQKQKMEILFTEKAKEENNWISQINQDINLICQWINNYLGAYFDKNIEIPDVPHITNRISSEGVLTYEKFNFEKLRKEIFDARKKIWERQVGFEETVENLKKEQIDFIDKINKLNKDIAKVKNENISLREELNKRNINLDEIQSNNEINQYNFE